MSKKQAVTLASSVVNAVNDTATAKKLNADQWNEVQWLLASVTPGQRQIRINWDFFVVADTERATDSKHLALLEEFKVVVDGMLTDGGLGPRKASVSSIQMAMCGIRELFRWMVHRRLTSVRQLDAHPQELFSSELPFLILNRAQFYGLPAGDFHEYQDDVSEQMEAAVEQPAGAADEEGGSASSAELLDVSASDTSPDSDADDDNFDATPDQVTHAQIEYRLRIIYYIDAQRERLEESGCLLSADWRAFGGVSIAMKAKSLARDIRKRIPPLPDEVADQLLASALKWIDIRADDVIALQNLYFERRSRTGPSSKHRRRKVAEVLQEFVFSPEAGSDEPWRLPLTSEIAVHPKFSHRVAHLDPPQIFRRLILRVRDAAVITLQYLVGLRIGEVCSIESGWNSEKDMPSCIVSKPSQDGLLEYLFVKGLVSKGRGRNDPAEWLIGCRPSGSLEIPLTVRALIVLETLFRHWREFSGRRELVLSFTNTRGVPWDKGSVSRPIVNNLTLGFSAFVYDEVDLSQLPDWSLRGEDLAPYRESRGLIIRPAQGRKTYVAYVLDIRISLIDAVRQQLHHLDPFVTKEGYYPAATQMRKELADGRLAESINYMMRVIGGERVVGPLADGLSEELKKIADATPHYAERRALVAEWHEQHNFVLFPADHGNCFIQMTPLDSQCRKATHSESWMRLTPHYGVRSPTMCAGCHAHLVDSSHLPYWERRYEEKNAAFQAAKAAGQQGEFAVVEGQAKQAEKMVKFFRTRLEAAP